MVIDMTPTTTETFRMLMMLLEYGTHEGKAFARKEFLRYAAFIELVEEKHDIHNVPTTINLSMIGSTI